MLQKSKIERRKNDKSRFFAVPHTAILRNADTKLRGRFGAKRRGPHIAAAKRISGPQNFRSSLQNDFCNMG